MVTSATTTAPRRARGLVAVLGVLAIVALGLTTTSASAAVPTLSVSPTRTSATALNVTWTSVPGAKSYQVEYSTRSDLKQSATTSAITGTATSLTKLETGSTYYLRVAALDAKAKAGTYSAIARGTPAFPFPAVGDLRSAKVTKTSMTVSWDPVKGAPGYLLVAAAKGSTSRRAVAAEPAATLTGLDADTDYDLTVTVVASPSGAAPLSAVSPRTGASTTRYALPTPDGLKQGKQGSTDVALSWSTVPGLPSGGGYRVEYALDSSFTGSATVTSTGPATRITRLRFDTTYFARIWGVDAGGKQITGKSDFVVAKSIVPRGSLRGTVRGVRGSDLMAVAYDRLGHAARQVGVDGNGNYRLDVRPASGPYKVQVLYVGTGNYASAFVNGSPGGGWAYGEGKTYGVALGQTTTLPELSIAPGTVTGGTVRGSGTAVPGVDVSIITGVPGGQREVVAMARTDGRGTFTSAGVPAGQYWFRYRYSGDGFKTCSVHVVVGRDRVKADYSNCGTPRAVVTQGKVNVDATLRTAKFRKSYGAYISGSKKVGGTLKAKATPWLAGQYPTTRASMRYRWKNNGKSIRGATRSSYKVARGDKGDKITVTATAVRFGYTTASATSKAARIS